MFSVAYCRIDSASSSSVQVNSMVLAWRSSDWMSKSLRTGCVGRDKGLLRWWNTGPRVQPSQMEAQRTGCSAAGRSHMKRSMAGLSAFAAGPTSTSLKDAPLALCLLTAFTLVPVRRCKGLRGHALARRGRFGRICGEGELGGGREEPRQQLAHVNKGRGDPHFVTKHKNSADSGSSFQAELSATSPVNWQPNSAFSWHM